TVFRHLNLFFSKGRTGKSLLQHRKWRRRWYGTSSVPQVRQEAVEQRIREEQRMMDEKIVLELDQKVIDQQSTLEKAGVSGCYITTDPQELTLQMNLLELIRKLQQKESQSEKAFS
ncbi:protein DGCR6-like, partial [Apteryx rowi]|uniref:protein DGCR6-like n=1 Tax=Apteryx rowi TaxID=308060 RepID=UPI000E1CC1DB